MHLHVYRANIIELQSILPTTHRTQQSDMYEILYLNDSNIKN